MIFTASVSAILVNIPQKQAAYNASKAALVHLAKSLAVEWTEFARVNCISPGFVETDILSIHPEEWRNKWFDMIPGARMAKAAELKSVSISKQRVWKTRADDFTLGVCLSGIRCLL